MFILRKEWIDILTAWSKQCPSIGVLISWVVDRHSCRAGWDRIIEACPGLGWMSPDIRSKIQNSAYLRVDYLLTRRISIWTQV